ncbi:hypothetical protein ACFSUK_00825 [Sphingobium scionense]
MRAAEELNLPRTGAVDDRDAAPAPQPLVQLSESPIVGMCGSIENEGLRDRCATMPASFEKYRARAVARGLLDEGDFLGGRPAGT